MTETSNSVVILKVGLENMIVSVSVVPDKTFVDSDYQAHIHQDDHVSPTPEIFIDIDIFLFGVVYNI